MAKKATRNSQYSEPQLILFAALELGATKWELRFSTGFGQKPRRRTIDAGETEQLQSGIRAAKKGFGLAQDAPVKSCYEAGRDGFWVDRYLKSIGIENIIVDSSSIEVNRRRRRAKTDSLDVGKLLVMLMRISLRQTQSVECSPGAFAGGRGSAPVAS